MPSFTPPTAKQPIDSSDRLLRWFSLDVGQSVVKKDGTYQVMPFPWIGELQAAGDEGTDWFLGGRTYEITDATADALEADGFTTDRTSGYSEGEFDDEEFGS